MSVAKSALDEEDVLDDLWFSQQKSAYVYVVDSLHGAYHEAITLSSYNYSTLPIDFSSPVDILDLPSSHGQSHDYVEVSYCYIYHAFNAYCFFISSLLGLSVL